MTRGTWELLTTIANIGIIALIFLACRYGAIWYYEPVENIRPPMNYWGQE